MSVDWLLLARRCKLTLDEKQRVIISCGDQRTHAVRVDDSDDFLRLWGVVLTKGKLEHFDESIDIDMWEQNRYREIVGFKVDARGRLVGEAWLPKIGLGEDEFRFAAELVGRACDQMEYVLTGKDVE